MVSAMISSLIQRAHDRAVEAMDLAPAGKRDQPHLAALAGFEPDSSPRSDIQTHAPCRRAIKVEAGIGFGEMEVTADLYRAVAGIGDHQRDRLTVGVQRDLAPGRKDLARDHGITASATPAAVVAAPRNRLAPSRPRPMPARCSAVVASTKPAA